MTDDTFELWLIHTLLQAVIEGGVYVLRVTGITGVDDSPDRAPSISIAYLLPGAVSRSAVSTVILRVIALPPETDNISC